MFNVIIHLITRPFKICHLRFRIWHIFISFNITSKVFPIVTVYNHHIYIYIYICHNRSVFPCRYEFPAVPSPLEKIWFIMDSLLQLGSRITHFTSVSMLRTLYELCSNTAQDGIPSLPNWPIPWIRSTVVS